MSEISNNVKSSIIRVKIDCIFNPMLANEPKTFITQSKNLANAWNSNENWPIECYSACVDAVEFFSNSIKNFKENPLANFLTLKEACNFLAKRRYEIAVKYDDKHQNKLGAYRTTSTPYYTLLQENSRYHDFMASLRIKAAEFGTGKASFNECYPDFLCLIARFSKLFTEDQNKVFQNSAAIIDQTEDETTKRNLRKVYIERAIQWINQLQEQGKCSFKLEKRVEAVYLCIWHNKIPYSKIGCWDGGLIIEHTQSIYLEDIFKDIEPKFQEILTYKKINSFESLQLLVEKIGLITWHLFHAMPYERGNASIQEMLIRTLLKFHGVKLPIYKNLIICDLLAIFEPNSEKFAKEFYNYFDWPSDIKDVFLTPMPEISKKEIHEKLIAYFQEKNTTWQNCCLAFDYLTMHYSHILNESTKSNSNKLALFKRVVSWEQTRNNLADIALQKLEQKCDNFFKHNKTTNVTEVTNLIAEARMQTLFKENSSNNSWLRKLEKMEKESNSKFSLRVQH